MVANFPEEIKENGRYNVTQTAELLKIDRKTLYNHTIQGMIKKRYRRVNNQPFYLGSDIKRYWEGYY